MKVEIKDTSYGKERYSIWKNGTVVKPDGGEGRLRFSTRTAAEAYCKQKGWAY